jgi:ubiquinone/menaquinone biosynthesis C-methylase UbiE
MSFVALYDRVMGLAERWPMGRLRGEVVAPSRGMVVEIAAGTGLGFHHYQAGAFVVATEPDLAMLQRARRRASDAKADIVLVAADAQCLPFRTGVFDTAVVALGLCTIPRPEEALGELHRVLIPAGVLRLLEHVRVDQPVVGWLQDFLTPVWRRLAGGCRLNQHTAQKVRQSGFRIVKLHSHVRGVFVTMLAEKVRLPH